MSRSIPHSPWYLYIVDMDYTCSRRYEVLDISALWQDATSGVPDILCGVTFLLRGERDCNRVLSYSVWWLESKGVMLTEIKVTLAHRIIAVPCRISYSLYFNILHTSGMQNECFWALWLNLWWIIHCGLLCLFALLAEDADLTEETPVSWSRKWCWPKC